MKQHKDMSVNRQGGGQDGKEEKTEEEKDDGPKRSNNIRYPIRSLRQLDRIHLNFESPHLREAMDDLGVSQDECQKK